MWVTAIEDSLSWQTNAVTAIPAYQTVDGLLTELKVFRDTHKGG